MKELGIIYGQGADLRDTGAAWNSCSGGWSCAGKLSLAGVGFIPFAGDIIKSVGQGAKHADEIVDMVGSATKQSGKLEDGMHMQVDDALTVAEDFLGKGYKELSNGRFVSEVEGGFNQVRMGLSDILGKHGGGPHINFEKLDINGKLLPGSKIHIFINN